MSMRTTSLLTRKFKEIRPKEEVDRIKDMLNYIRTSKYPKKVNENVVLDVLILINDGFENGQSLDEIIGNDDKKFIDEIFLNLNEKQYKIFSPKIIFNIILLSLLEILISVMEYDKGIFDYKFLLLRVIIYIAIVGLTFHYEYYFKHYVYDKDKKRKYKYIHMAFLSFFYTLFYFSIFRIFEFKIYMLLYLLPGYFSIQTSFKE